MNDPGVAYSFTFGVGAQVVVKALTTSGVVCAVMRDVMSANQYRVVYYINNERRDQWLYGFELELQ